MTDPATAPAAPSPPAPSRAPRDGRRRLLWVVGVALVLAVAALVVGPRLYAASQEGEAAAPLTAAPEAAPAQGAATDAALDGGWTVVAGGTAGYRVDEVLNGQPVTVTGRTDRVSGALTVAGGALTAGEVAVDLASVTTGSSQRDGQFAEIVGVEANPAATFTVTGATDLGGLETAGSAVAVVLPGVLTLNGQARDVQVDATAERTDDDTLTVTGSVPVTWADHGVQAPDLGFVSVQDAGALEFRVVADHD